MGVNFGVGESVLGWSFLRGTFSEERFLSDSPPNLLNRGGFIVEYG